MAEVDQVPAMIVEAFYRVRFRGDALDKQQSQAVELALERLEDLLRGKASGGR